MKAFLFEFRGRRITVTYTLTRSWEAFWFAVRERNGKSEHFDGITTSKANDEHIEARIVRAICERIDSLPQTDVREADKQEIP